MKTNSATNIIIVILIVTALGLGYVIFQQRTSSRVENLPAPISSQTEDADASSTPPIQGGTEREFTIFIGPSTKIFGIDQDNPYKGEPPATIAIGPGGIPPADLSRPFEIFGDVLRVDLQEQAVHITTDSPRNIDSEFTPRGPRISLEDIQMGDRIVVSDSYDEEGSTDFRDIDFIQVLPPR